ncbi:hypothetical protein LRAMOSA06366 [Lichtheimia ramosa]|uniref:VHS domain-containing protein n=1 Tax=Lichtheimia ramosa TaxID=688394 RepID=A0A077X2X8_9FUNG|nr:hypothetical protein LRAMOSA06366 [Lichtheimia ramosa]
MKNIFSKKITPTTITTNVEKATDPSMQEMDWSLVFAICDVVNNTEQGAKEARKLLQKKMLADNPQTQVLALELLDALSQNCQAKFQGQLSAKSFAEDLDTLATSKSSNDQVHSKLIMCLQNWVTRYGADPGFIGVHRVYERLTLGTSHAPPPRRGNQNLVFRLATPAQFQLQQQQYHRQQQQQQQQQQQTSADPASDVLLAKNNAQLFSQTLSFTDPTQEDITKNELIQEFYGKCKMFQKILARHLETCNDSDIISSLLEANSELVTAFKAYDDMLERRAMNEATRNSETLHNRSTRPHQQQQQQQEADVDLLGLGDSSSGSNHYQSRPADSSNSSSQLQQPAVNFDLHGGGGNNKNATSKTAPLVAVDPFDPFADTQQAAEGNTSSSSGDAGRSTNTLPPPLTPQKMYE